jgi:S1-C subfamily serine protease
MMLGLAMGGLLMAAPPIEQMKQQTVLLFQVVKTPKGLSTSSGSGVLVDATHVVTNHHVCCLVPPGMEAKVALAAGPDNLIEVEVLWSSEEKDLALLVLKKPLNAPPVVFAPKAMIRIGEPVWAVGYPGSAMRLGNEKAVYESTVTQGIASRIFQGPTQAGGVEYVQTTAAVNPGNSGGPLFDDCGQVIAINEAKAMTSLGKGMTFAEGINLSVIVDELLPELDKHQVAYKTGEACVGPAAMAPSTPGWMVGSQVASVVLAVAAILLAFNRKVRHTVAKSLHLAKDAEPPRAAPGVARTAWLLGASGAWQGQKIPLGASPVVIGRDPGVANVVVSADAPGVSKRHCQVSVHEASGRVYVEDLFSTHGTFRNGQKIESGRPVELQPGDRLTLGGPGTAFDFLRQ